MRDSASESSSQVQGRVVTGHLGRLTEGTAALSSPASLYLCGALREKFFYHPQLTNEEMEAQRQQRPQISELHGRATTTARPA